jgi:pimeloyl-ACP methyl ester carboxylesterase
MAVTDIEVADGRVRVEVQGTGMPLLLLHGWTLDRSIWSKQMDALSGQFLVVAIDRRGFGQSTAPPDLGSEIADILAVQSALELDAFLLLGMSQGGRVALQFASQHPAALRGLILQGAPLEGYLEEQRGEDMIPLAAYADLVKHGALADMQSHWSAHPLMHAESDDIRAELDSIVKRYEARDLMVFPGKPFGLSFDDLATVAVPTLSLTGERDTPWRQKVADAFAAHIPGATRCIIPGGHLCNFTHPREFNAQVSDFGLALQA